MAINYYEYEAWRQQKFDSGTAPVKNETIKKCNKSAAVNKILCEVDVRSAYRVLFGKYKGKKLVGRPSWRWVDHRKLFSKEQEVNMWNEFIWFQI
jgi:hypothetical protein